MTVSFKRSRLETERLLPWRQSDASLGPNETAFLWPRETSEFDEMLKLWHSTPHPRRAAATNQVPMAVQGLGGGMSDKVTPRGLWVLAARRRKRVDGDDEHPRYLGSLSLSLSLSLCAIRRRDDRPIIDRERLATSGCHFQAKIVISSWYRI